MKILTSVLRSTITAVLLVAVTAGFGLTSHAALVSIDFGPGAVEPGFDSFPAGGTNSKTFGGVTVSLSTFGDGLAIIAWEAYKFDDLNKKIINALIMRDTIIRIKNEFTITREKPDSQY